MGCLTIVAFLTVCFVGVSNCIPVERQVNPASIPYTSTTTTTVASSSVGYQGIKRETNDGDDNSSESQESHESSEKDKDRSARDAGFSTSSVTQMSPTMSTGMFKQELPSRESRGVYYGDFVPPRVQAESSQSKPGAGITTTTVSTISTTSNSAKSN